MAKIKLKKIDKGKLKECCIKTNGYPCGTKYKFSFCKCKCHKKLIGTLHGKAIYQND